MSFNKLKTLVQKGDNRQHAKKMTLHLFLVLTHFHSRLFLVLTHFHSRAAHRNCRCVLNRNFRKCKRHSTRGIVMWPESVSKMADEGTSTRRKGWKRLRFESEWVRKKRKTEKDSGEAYTTYKGDPKPAKQLIAITCRCHHRCSQKLNLSERKRIFDEFYMLKNSDAQSKYLYGLISRLLSVNGRKLALKEVSLINITSGAAMVLT